MATARPRSTAHRLKEIFWTIGIPDVHKVGSSTGPSAVTTYVVLLRSGITAHAAHRSIIYRCPSVRGVDTLLTDAFGVVVVSFFCAPSEQELAAAAADSDSEPVAITPAHAAAIANMSVSLSLGSEQEWPLPFAAAVCDAVGGCVGVWSDGGQRVVALADARSALMLMCSCQAAAQRSKDRAEGQYWGAGEGSLGCYVEGTRNGLAAPGLHAGYPRRQDPVAGWDGSPPAASFRPPQAAQRPAVPESTSAVASANGAAEDDSQFEITPQAIRDHSDSRTIIMIRCIPKHFHRDQCVQWLLELLQGRCTTMILPTLRNRHANAGLAYVHVTTPDAILPVFDALHGKLWSEPDAVAKRRPLEVVYAKIQDMPALKTKWMQVDETCVVLDRGCGSEAGGTGCAPTVSTEEGVRRGTSEGDESWSQGPLSSAGSGWQ
mmetsp:Transcript_16273/g.41565  ORF Transcript_16273/g.41565 Transcript_16273/m.41565 type:complete len:433 (-) Transcript_16273:286-1584(-)